jgi:8-oxo-dGTP pyrophosphatase MutT (NUDIX family)
MNQIVNASGVKCVIGFAFNKAHTKLLLQLKKKGPKFNVGYLNPPGGKVKQYPTPEELKYESAVQGMVREFREETGLESTKDDWMQFHYERHQSGTELFCYVTDNLDIMQARSMEIEPNVIVEFSYRRFPEFRFPSGYIWCLNADDSSSALTEYNERIDVQLKERGGLAYNMPYMIPMALAYLEHPEHRYLEG